MQSEVFEPLLGCEDASRLLGGLHIKTLQRKARGGKIPAHFIFGRWYFRASELNEWFQQSSMSGRSARANTKGDC